MGKDFQQKDLEGVLFKNDEATPENKQPAYSGSITIKGVKYNLGAWINIGKQSGKKFMSLRASPWGQREKQIDPSKEAAQSRGGGGGQESDFQDDDVPFITNAGIH